MRELASVWSLFLSWIAAVWSVYVLCFLAAILAFVPLDWYEV